MLHQLRKLYCMQPSSSGLSWLNCPSCIPNQHPLQCYVRHQRQRNKVAHKTMIIASVQVLKQQARIWYCAGVHQSALSPDPAVAAYASSSPVRHMTQLQAQMVNSNIPFAHLLPMEADAGPAEPLGSPPLNPLSTPMPRSWH